MSCTLHKYFALIYEQRDGELLNQVHLKVNMYAKVVCCQQ